MKDVWAAGESYEPYVGRWSRKVADEFFAWLDLDQGSRCLDVGCGTGALSSRLVAIGPTTGVDPSEGFVAYAAEHVPEASFQVADAQSLPFPDDSFDAAVSGLVLNFVPDQRAMVSEMRRVVRPRGTVALYVWDYAEGMQFMRLFWDVANELDRESPDEAARFPICAPGPLADLFDTVGLEEVEGREIVVPTVFENYDDFWSPFLLGQGAAPAYYATLPEAQQRALDARLRETVPVEPDGTIALTARVWAVRGRT